MTVADNTSRNQYTATSGQTVFAYTFEIVDKSHIVVLKNGTTLSEGTDYTVSNVGNDNGGNVTLTSGATAGDILTLYRDMPYSRTQNYTNSGDFLASEVNSDFDNLWLAGEQTDRSFSQSVRKPITDSDSISMELPEAADRAGKLLSFTSDGSVSVATSSTDGTVSNLVTYTPAGTGAVDTTVEAKLRENISVKDFGAVGDGTTDDTTAITNAISKIASGGVLEFPFGTYKITSAISQDITGSIIFQGRNSTISYENASHTEYAIRLNDTAGVDIVINDITIDGTKKANKVFEVLNDTSNTTASNFVANELKIENCKRLDEFVGGDGVHIIGAFHDVTFNGGSIKDCELPEDQGTQEVVGITGLNVRNYSLTSYVKRLTLNGLTIEKVYSSDGTYTYDQDGVKFFAPDESGGSSGKVESNLIVMGGCQFINCYGRSIKTQCRNTIVRDSHFERSEGLTGGVGNPEIGSQTGSCVVDSCTFSYSNSQQPENIVSPSTATGWQSGASILNNEVYLDGLTLDTFMRPFPSAVVDPWTRMEVKGNRILGTVTRFVDFLTNATKAHLTVADNWVDDIADGPTTEKALVYVRASGGSAPRVAYINIVNNVYAGSNTVYLARDNVSGTAMRGTYSGYGNFGFVDDLNTSVNDATPLESVALPARITAPGTYVGNGYFAMQTKAVNDTDTETFNFRANNASLILFQSNSGNQAYAMISVSSSAIEINSGTQVSVGATTNPNISGDFNIWRSGTGEISVENQTGSNRTCSVWVFSPN